MMNKNTVSVILLLVIGGASFSIGWILHNPETLVVYNNTITFVEVPVVVTNTVTEIEIETIEIQTLLPIYINNTEIHYIPTPMPLIDFPRETVLMTWIKSDQTDKLDYEDRWDCMDFTLRTIRNAEQDGYRIYFLYHQSEEHALTMAYVIEEAKYIVWEPQTDQVEWEWNSNEGG